MLTTDWKMTAPTTIAIAVVDVRRNTRLYSCRNEHMQRKRVGEHESECVASHKITSGTIQESVSTVVTQTSHAIKIRDADYSIIYTT